MSIASKDVPRISYPYSFSLLAIRKGVCPPNCTTTPLTVPSEFSLSMIFLTNSKSKGSKYSLSDVS